MIGYGGVGRVEGGDDGVESFKEAFIGLLPHKVLQFCVPCHVHCRPVDHSGSHTLIHGLHYPQEEV